MSTSSGTAACGPDGQPALGSPQRDPGARVLPWPWLGAAWAAVAVLTLLALVPWLQQDASPLRALDVAVAVAALVLLPALWTRWSVPAALVLAALAAVSGAATPASTVATLQVARWRGIRTALPVAAAGFAGHAVLALWRPVGLPLGWWLLCDLAVHAALLGWGAYGRARAALVRSLRERAWRAEAEQERRVEEARLVERTRIAREMHDTLAHRLSLLATTAGALEYRPDAPPERLAAAAALVRQGVSSALDDLRDVVRVLREEPTVPGAPRAPAPRPGIRDVARLVDEARAVGQDVTLEATGDDDPPPAVATAVYRAAQEGLTNARRHAPGSRVVVRVDLSPGVVRLRVGDGGASGPGVPVGPGSGTGLVGLRERVGLVGGHVEAHPQGRGFVLDVRIPWQA
ncbi:sensor histidine kinase [Cellulomonas wangsupingiae]|uniref:sensor histidine kinase n=1 Tax=Cellulomonas wangsupingiae TaxID=2968085 RepID=UPI0025478425|nr:sensor histidine kinase [Cellulomonas wangsupingiae]